MHAQPVAIGVSEFRYSQSWIGYGLQSGPSCASVSWPALTSGTSPYVLGAFYHPASFPTTAANDPMTVWFEGQNRFGCACTLALLAIASVDGS